MWDSALDCYTSILIVMWVWLCSTHMVDCFVSPSCLDHVAPCTCARCFMNEGNTFNSVFKLLVQIGPSHFEMKNLIAH